MPPPLDPDDLPHALGKAHAAEAGRFSAGPPHLRGRLPMPQAWRFAQAPSSAQRLLDAVSASASLALFEMDADGIVLFSDGAGRDAIADRPASTVGRSVFDLYGHAPEVTAAARRALAGETFTDTVRVPRKGGGEVAFQTTYLPVRGADGRVQRVLGVALDVSERVDAALGLKRAKHHLRRLALRAQRDHEADRLRTAREVHDALGGEQTGIRYAVSAALARLAAGDVKGVRARLREIDQAAARTTEAVKRIAAELRPPALDAGGLVPALEEEARRFGERAGTPCAFAAVVPEEVRGAVPPALETAVYRVAQEALTNVSRHAQASAAWLTLAFEPEQRHPCDSGEGDEPNAAGLLFLDVVDDGRGAAMLQSRGEDPDGSLGEPLPVGPGYVGAGLGLLGMRERAAEWGGAVWVSPGLEGGTRVTAIFRVPDPEEVDRKGEIGRGESASGTSS
jgi:signal transduction histidine kinase